MYYKKNTKMKPNKYDALEFCRRTINGCTNVKQFHVAYNLIMNFREMFSDYWCNMLLIKEWENKYNRIMV